MLHAVILAFAFGISSFAHQNCPETLSGALFKPPSPYSTSFGGPGFLYGTPALWTYIETPMHATDGTRLSAKLVYWRVGFDWRSESRPDLKVIAKRLDAPAPLVEAQETNGVLFGDDLANHNPSDMAMMTGIEIPEPGCWQIVATYKTINTLSYIVQVVP